MTLRKKLIITIVVLSLVLSVQVVGTLAWLTAKSGPVTNTFTYGDINIALTETTTDYKMVPGNDIAKDPKVTVKPKSEACYLFVKIEKSANYDNFLEAYVVTSDWKALDGVDGVYYLEVSANDAENGISYNILNGKDNFESGYVTVKTTVTKADMNAIDGIVDEDAAEGAADAELAYRPTLTFTAYAVQLQENNNTKFEPAEAWAILFPPANT